MAKAVLRQKSRLENSRGRFAQPLKATASKTAKTVKKKTVSLIISNNHIAKRLMQHLIFVPIEKFFSTRTHPYAAKNAALAIESARIIHMIPKPRYRSHGSNGALGPINFPCCAFISKITSTFIFVSTDTCSLNRLMSGMRVLD